MAGETVTVLGEPGDGNIPRLPDLPRGHTMNEDVFREILSEELIPMLEGILSD